MENQNENNEEKTEEKPIEVLPPKNLKEWFTNSLVGFFVGLAVIVPGISGATISIIFKIYDKMLSAVSNIFKKFHNSFLFLLPIILGGIVGFIGGFFGVKAALSVIPFAIICLFGGLMIGAYPAVYDEIKDAQKTPLRIALLVLGFILPVAVSVSTALLGEGRTGAFDTIEWWEFLVFLIAGFAVAITQVVPGLSASAFLMMIGYFRSLMDTVDIAYWRTHPAIFGIYAMLIIGFLLGFFVTSKVLNVLFAKNRKATFFPIVGLSAGAIVSIFFNPEVYEVYQIWADPSSKPGSDYPNAVAMPIDLSVGIVLLIVGFALSFALYLYQKRQDAKALKLENKQ